MSSKTKSTPLFATVITVNDSSHLPSVTFTGEHASLTASQTETAEEDSLINSLVTILMAVPEVPVMQELLSSLGLEISYTEVEDA